MQDPLIINLNLSQKITETRTFTSVRSQFKNIGRIDDHTQPHVVQALRGLEVQDVSLGNCHGAALTLTGELLTWGSGDHGQLGHGEPQAGERNDDGLYCVLVPRVVQALAGC